MIAVALIFAAIFCVASGALFGALLTYLYMDDDSDDPVRPFLQHTHFRVVPGEPQDRQVWN